MFVGVKRLSVCGALVDVDVEALCQWHRLEVLGQLDCTAQEQLVHVF